MVGGFVDATSVGCASSSDAVRADGLSPAGAEQIVNCVIAIEQSPAGCEVLGRESGGVGSWKARGCGVAGGGLARRAGTSTGEAKETLATSKKLPSQPKLANALRNGKLSSARPTRSPRLRR